MVGLYPDPPGRRIPWDIDGSQLVRWNNSSLVLQTLATMQILNDENTTNSYQGLQGGEFLALIFPAPMQIVAYTHQQSGSNGSKLIEYSLNTTNGQDGAWSIITGPSNPVGSPGHDYRLHTVTAGMPLSNVKAVRTRSASGTGEDNIINFHWYGYRSSTVGDALMLWHATLDQPFSSIPAAYDKGDLARGSGPNITSFRVKNCSASLTANTVALSRDILTDTSPANIGLVTVRYNAGTYGTTAAIGTLGPGAISLVCDAKIDLTSAATPGRMAPRIVATAGSWA
jgi:hypothetical protein